MKLVRSLKGCRPIAFTSNGILLAKAYKLYIANLDCTKLKFIMDVPHSLFINAVQKSRVLERTLRLGIRLGCAISEFEYLLAEKGRIWRLDLEICSLELDHYILNGSMPLSLSYIHDVQGFDDVACYGEYTGNPLKKPVSIWTSRNKGEWNIAFTFPEGAINHIHAIIPDKKRGLVWVLTGDFENASGMWLASDNFSSVIPLLIGKQEFRSCWLAFLGDRCIYATDSQLNTNSIREQVFHGEKSKEHPLGDKPSSDYIMDISGSSIYSCMVQDQLVFSTTVEPGLPTGFKIYDLLLYKLGPGIKSNYSDLVIGNLESGFSVAGKWRKDKLPLRLCGFGSIQFPTGYNPGHFLYAHFSGLLGCDGSMSLFEII